MSAATYLRARIGAVLTALRRSRDPLDPTQAHLPPAGRTAAGVRINADNAACVSTVWACLRYISQTTAIFPWRVMRPAQLGAELADSHPTDWLLHKRPNPEWSSFQFRETLTHWALRHGNGYAEIERDALARPIALWPLPPDRVVPIRDVVTGALLYRVYDPGGRTYVDLGAADMFHIRGFGEDVVGVNVMDYAAESIGWARAAQLFGASFFGSGMNVTSVVQSKRTLTEPAMRRLKAAFNRLYRGVRGERVMFLDDGMEYKPLGIEPEKGQFLETSQFLVPEITRWFGVPPHKVGDLSRATFSNIESQAIEVVVDCIAPWVKRFEDEADAKLFGQNRAGFYTKMNMNALMRGDSAARAAFYREMRLLGVFSANDIAEREDINLIPPSQGGDKRIVQSQFTTLEQVGAVPVLPPPSPRLPIAPPAEQAAVAAIVAMQMEETIAAE